MYNLKASLYMYVTVCLPSFVAKTYDERKICPDFAFRSSINIHHVPPPPKEKKQEIDFRVRAKIFCFLGELLFEEIVGYDASVNVNAQLCKHALSKPS